MKPLSNSDTIASTYTWSGTADQFWDWGGGGGGGRTISDSILGERGTKHFLLLIIYNFKNVGGHVAPLLRGPWR